MIVPLSSLWLFNAISEWDILLNIHICHMSTIRLPTKMTNDHWPKMKMQIKSNLIIWSRFCACTMYVCIRKNSLHSRISIFLFIFFLFIFGRFLSSSLFHCLFEFQEYFHYIIDIIMIMMMMLITITTTMPMPIPMPWMAWWADRTMQWAAVTAADSILKYHTINWYLHGDKRRRVCIVPPYPKLECHVRLSHCDCMCVCVYVSARALKRQ